MLDFSTNLYPSTITVSGIQGTIPSTPGSVKVTINNFSHTWPDDVAIALVGPTGAALTIQDGAGAGTAMTNVTYTLSDRGAAHLPDSTAWAAGTYKPTSYYESFAFPAPGPAASGHPGPSNGGTATFSTVFGGTNPNGDWKLFVIDVADGDTGSISGGWSLEITPFAVPANDAPVDINGDGKTDYVTIRNTGGGANGQATWYTSFADGFPTNPTDWGIASDQFVPADFDGDGKDDFAVFRPSSGVFYIVRSGTSTMFTEQFGQNGDDASVVGDYTGDNIDDLAVYRDGATPSDVSRWYYRSIGSPPGFQTIPWGQGGDFPAPGDYDGDGKYDFVVQREDSNGVNGRFWVRLATGTQYSLWFGLRDDSVVPGDYDGDGKTDVAVARFDNGQIRWEFEPSGTAGHSVISDTWGVAATDWIAQGDYDGDGQTDYGIYRPGSPGTFYVMTPIDRRIWTRIWGEASDFPAANYNVH